MRKWLPLVILASAQFIMVLDSSVMNVSISQIVADLNTTVTGVQSAITMYTLVMAAFMLVGAKLGDILGRDRAFGLGLAVYGLGSLITALSPNLTVLLIGWSGIEGLGAVLVIPAIAALTAANYEGKERAFAYGMIGGAAGAAIAAGPLIGGYVTTTWSWRYVFVGEVVVVIAVLIVHRRMKRAPKPEEAPKLDYGGAALSAVALGLIVFGILKSSTWGWIRPIDAPTIDGHEITPLGFSLVPFLIVGGFVVLGCFLAWEERRERLGRSTLLNRALLKIETLRGGLSSLSAQQLIVMGTFFVLPVYLQVVLGFDAFETGKRLFPMSISMLAAALTGPKVAVRFGPRAVVQVGLGAMAIAALVLVGTIDVTLNGTAFAVSLIFFGIGAGLLMSQLGNVIMSSAPPEETNEAGGLQGTAQNLGASLGTALIGSVLLLGLLNGFNSRIEENPALPSDVKTQIAAATEEGIPIVTTEQAHQALLDAGLAPAEADAVTADYSNAQLDALKTSMLAVAFLAVLSFWFTRRLPGRPRDRPLGSPLRPARQRRCPAGQDRRRDHEPVRDGHRGHEGVEGRGDAADRLVREQLQRAVEAGASRYEHEHPRDDEDERRAAEPGPDEAAGEADGQRRDEDARLLPTSAARARWRRAQDRRGAHDQRPGTVRAGSRVNASPAATAASRCVAAKPVSGTRPRSRRTSSPRSNARCRRRRRGRVAGRARSRCWRRPTGGARLPARACRS